MNYEKDAVFSTGINFFLVMLGLLASLLGLVVMTSIVNGESGVFDLTWAWAGPTLVMGGSGLYSIGGCGGRLSYVSHISLVGFLLGVVGMIFTPL